MRYWLSLVIVVLALPAVGLRAQGGRLNDRQIEQLVENIDRGFDRWKDDLERRNMDDAVLRSASGTIDVRRFLQDMERDIDLVKDRIDSDYAANPEVTSLLRRASDVERRAQTGGAPSEAWKTLGGQFAALAGAYGLAWPIDASATAQRKMDRELAVDARRLADATDRLRNGALRAASDAKLPQADRDTADRGMRELRQAARQLESNLKGGRAVAADATRVLDLSKQAVSFARSAGPMRDDATAALTAVETATQSIAAAFGTP